ncbi:hypothetical protein ARMSODRAFT_981556 [Armillaria solidipes]|uniref:Uncharacterized protein n=1 Tax=Armillaria solidipes TaxID=1076256 RepID=A0A2H3BC38_9AGAR|nr:hypothetical protein ARMSODRAFT_981556 [Armillaria solidipes]
MHIPSESCKPPRLVTGSLRTWLRYFTFAKRLLCRASKNGEVDGKAKFFQVPTHIWQAQPKMEPRGPAASQKTSTSYRRGSNGALNNVVRNLLFIPATRSWSFHVLGPKLCHREWPQSLAFTGFSQAWAIFSFEGDKVSTQAGNSRLGWACKSAAAGEKRKMVKDIDEIGSINNIVVISTYWLSSHTDQRPASKRPGNGLFTATTAAFENLWVTHGMAYDGLLSYGCLRRVAHRWNLLYRALPLDTKRLAVLRSDNGFSIQGSFLIAATSWIIAALGKRNERVTGRRASTGGVQRRVLLAQDPPHRKSRTIARTLTSDDFLTGASMLQTGDISYIQDSMLGQTRGEWVNRYDAVQDNLLGISMHKKLASSIVATIAELFLIFFLAEPQPNNYRLMDLRVAEVTNDPGQHAYSLIALSLQGCRIGICQDDFALTAIVFERRMAKSFATGAIPFQVHDAAPIVPPRFSQKYLPLPSSSSNDGRSSSINYDAYITRLAQVVPAHHSPCVYVTRLRDEILFLGALAVVLGKRTLSTNAATTIHFCLNLLSLMACRVPYSHRLLCRIRGSAVLHWAVYGLRIEHSGWRMLLVLPSCFVFEPPLVIVIASLLFGSEPSITVRCWYFDYHVAKVYGGDCFRTSHNYSPAWILMDRTMDDGFMVAEENDGAINCIGYTGRPVPDKTLASMTATREPAKPSQMLTLSC